MCTSYTHTQMQLTCTYSYTQKQIRAVCAIYGQYYLREETGAEPSCPHQQQCPTAST